MKSYRLNRKAKGFGLLEVILVFAIVIGAAAVVFTVFQSAKPSADASNEGSNVTTLATNLKSTYGINNSYSGLTKATAIQAKAVPASMIDTAGNVNSSWGAVDVNAAGAIAGTACATANRCFDINYTAVPTDTCAKLVQGVAGFFDDVKVAGTSVFTNNKVANDKVVSNCAGASGASTVAIDFVGH